MSELIRLAKCASVGEDKHEGQHSENDEDAGKGRDSAPQKETSVLHLGHVAKRRRRAWFNCERLRSERLA